MKRKPELDGPALIYGDFPSGVPEKVLNSTHWNEKPLAELVADAAAIRAEQKRERKKHTTRVKSQLP